MRSTAPQPSRPTFYPVPALRHGENGISFRPQPRKQPLSGCSPSRAAAALATLSLRKARIEHGKLYISKSIGLRDQIVCLEDESDLLVTDHGQIRIAGAFHINAV